MLLTKLTLIFASLVSLGQAGPLLDASTALALRETVKNTDRIVSLAFHYPSHPPHYPSQTKTNSFFLQVIMCTEANWLSECITSPSQSTTLPSSFLLLGILPLSFPLFLFSFFFCLMII